MTKTEKETLEHKTKVFKYLAQAAGNLTIRGYTHDDSKLGEREAEGFEIVSKKLSSVVYPSKEYDDALKELQPYLKHHYESNSHHPEHFEKGIGGMTLFDLLEMLCDWKASSERTKDGGSIYRSIVNNEKRFKMSEQLVSIFRNTVKEMQWDDKNANEDGSPKV